MIKEHAYRAVKRHCRAMEVQLLDDCVALNRMRLQRDESGRLRIVREFHFEFSATGDDRYDGVITISGRHILAIRMAPYRIDEW